MTTIQRWGSDWWAMQPIEERPLEFSWALQASPMRQSMFPVTATPRNALARAGYIDWRAVDPLARLRQATDADLLGVQYIGRTYLAQIRAVIPGVVDAG